MKLFRGHREPGLFWFRFCGYGLSGKRFEPTGISSRPFHPLLFSEREYKRGFRAGHWIFHFLAPMATAEMADLERTQPIMLRMQPRQRSITAGEHARFDITVYEPSHVLSCSATGGIATIQDNDLDHDLKYIDFDSTGLAPGTYTITCTATKPDGHERTVLANIFVGAPPEPYMTPVPYWANPDWKPPVKPEPEPPNIAMAPLNSKRKISPE